MKKLFLFIFLTSCSLIKVESENKLSPFPAKPQFTELKANPIIGKQENNFIVIPEFIKRTTEERIYLKSVLEWKNKNGIKE